VKQTHEENDKCPECVGLGCAGGGGGGGCCEDIGDTLGVILAGITSNTVWPMLCSNNCSDLNNTYALLSPGTFAGMVGKSWTYVLASPVTIACSNPTWSFTARSIEAFIDGGGNGGPGCYLYVGIYGSITTNGATYWSGWTNWYSVIGTGGLPDPCEWSADNVPVTGEDGHCIYASSVCHVTSS
jgi:hypothetical protein